MPTVSILIPVHNAARWLPATIDSVRAQGFDDWELITLDDGSTDGSVAVLSELAGQERRLRVISRPSRGVVATRNELLCLARGEFVAWLDSDDLMTPDRLALQLDRFAKEPGLLLLGGACTLMDPEGLPIRTHAFPLNHESLVEAMKTEIAFYFPSVTMRREAALRLGGFREPFAISEDFDLCLRMSEIGRVGNVPDVVLFYRQHLGSLANSHRAQCDTYSRLVRELALERAQQGRDRLQRGEAVAVNFGRLPSRRRNAVETHRRWAWWALGSGHLQTARKYAWQALGRAPLEVESWRLAACALRGH